MTLNPFLLAADDAPELRQILRDNPAIASQQDEHGYSLLHAASSYGHISLLRFLANELPVNINLQDEDGETCLFVVESVAVATCLVEELHVDTALVNEDGMTAAEKIADEGDFPDVAAYLKERERGGGGGGGGSVVACSRTGDAADAAGRREPPPRLPDNITLDVNAALPDDLPAEPDPDFRKRIEELAAKEDFQGRESQNELRALVTDAVREVTVEESSSRRRV